MRNTVLKAVAIAVALSPAIGLAQSKATSATYITDEEVKAVNATPGVDRTIRVVDIGPENYAIGVIHRGASNAAGRGAGTGAGAGAGADRGAVPFTCGVGRFTMMSSGLREGDEPWRRRVRTPTNWPSSATSRNWTARWDSSPRSPRGSAISRS
jgi:hypothetical protein